MPKILASQGLNFFLHALGKDIDFLASYYLYGLALWTRCRRHKQISVRTKTALFNGDQRRFPRFLAKRDKIPPVYFRKRKVTKQAGIDILAVYLENLAEFVACVTDFTRRILHRNSIAQNMGFAKRPFFSYDGRQFKEKAMSDIFREVDEALQREKAAAFWKEYGPTLLGCALVIVLSTAATTGYMHWKESHNRAETTKIVDAMESPDMIAAMQTATENMDGGHKAIGLLNAANKAANDKNFAQAAELYSAIAQDRSAPSDLRDLSSILSVRTALQDASPDYQKLVDQLEPVTKNKSSVFYDQARIEAAALYGSGLKDYTRALDLLKGFDQETNSDSLKEKASALKHVYEYEASQSTTTTE